MAGRTSSASTLARIAVACALLGGCVSETPAASIAGGSVAPTDPNPGADASNGPIASPQPTGPTVPEWTFTRIPTRGHPNWAVGSPGGLVVVGICEPGVRPSRWHGCDPDAPDQAAVVSSSDGRIWQHGTVEGGIDSDMRYVVWNGDYVAIGMRCTDASDRRICPQEAQVWRSDDGLDWSLISSLSFGDGRHAGPGRPYVRSFAKSASGALMLGWAHRVDEPGASGIYRSPDGITWSRVDSSEFFLDREWDFGFWRNPYDVIATDSGFLVVGTGCNTCRVRAFASADGGTWQHVGDLPVNPELHRINLVTNGRHILALVILENFAEVWGSPDGGETWTRRLGAAGVPTLGSAGGVFVLLDDVTYTTDGVQVARISADGESWTELRPVFRADANAEPERACINFIGGGPDGVLIGSDCGVWHAHLP